MTTVNTVALLIGNNFKKDFESGSQCRFTFYSNGTAPSLQIGEEWSILEGQFDLKIECNHNKTDTEFHQVATIELDITANFTLALYEDYLFKLDIYDLNLYPAYVFDTEYKVNMVFLRGKMNIVDGVVMGFIDAMFENGTSIQDFIEKTPLCFINMTKA